MVEGTAEINCGEWVMLLAESQSIYILIGKIHRFANLRAIPFEIVEVQSGSFLGDKDIVRFEDN